jgi:DNA replication licensing factor MCM4
MQTDAQDMPDNGDLVRFSSSYDCMQVATQQSATDPTTGTIDMDCINTGVSSSVRRARDQLSNEVLALLKSK